MDVIALKYLLIQILSDLNEPIPVDWWAEVAAEGYDLSFYKN